MNESVIVLQIALIENYFLRKSSKFKTNQNYYGIGFEGERVGTLGVAVLLTSKKTKYLPQYIKFELRLHLNILFFWSD